MFKTIFDGDIYTNIEQMNSAGNVQPTVESIWQKISNSFSETPSVCNSNLNPVAQSTWQKGNINLSETPSKYNSNSEEITQSFIGFNKKHSSKKKPNPKIAKPIASRQKQSSQQQQPTVQSTWQKVNSNLSETPSKCFVEFNKKHSSKKKSIPKIAESSFYRLLSTANYGFPSKFIGKETLKKMSKIQIEEMNDFFQFQEEIFNEFQKHSDMACELAKSSKLHAKDYRKKLDKRKIERNNLNKNVRDNIFIENSFNNMESIAEGLVKESEWQQELADETCKWAHQNKIMLEESRKRLASEKEILLKNIL